MLVKPAENQFSLYCTKNARLQALVFASADVFFDMRGIHTRNRRTDTDGTSLKTYKPIQVLFLFIVYSKV